MIYIYDEINLINFYYYFYLIIKLNRSYRLVKDIIFIWFWYINVICNIVIIEYVCIEEWEKNFY